jgi:hypothetical protein
MANSRNPAKVWLYATADVARLGRPALLALAASVLIAGCGSPASTQPESTTFTPVPTRSAASKVKLGPISYSHAQISRIQNGAIAGKGPYVHYLNPVWVVSHALPQRGIDPPFQIYPPLRVGLQDQGLRDDVLLSQPLRSGDSGIWVISSILVYRSGGKQAGPDPGRPIRVIPVTHTSSELQRIQGGADQGVPKFELYRDPLQVIAHDMRYFGLGARFTLKPRLTLLVLKGLGSYDVELTQPGLKGSAGIWLLSNIEPHNGGEDQG